MRTSLLDLITDLAVRLAGGCLAMLGVLALLRWGSGPLEVLGGWFVAWVTFLAQAITPLVSAVLLSAIPG